MGSQLIQESAETLRGQRGWVSTLCLSAMLVGAFSVSLMASPANAGDKHQDRDDNDNKRSLVMRPYSDHSFRYMVMQLQREVEKLRRELAARPTGTGTGPSQADFNTLKGRVDAAETKLGEHTTGLTEVNKHLVPGLKDYLKIETTALNGMLGPHIVVTGANVHIRNGMTTTNTTNSLGNLVLGYNETAQGVARDGSHNLVSGQGNSFRSFGGLVFGMNNVISGPYATILGGGTNQATGAYSSVIGGQGNISASNYQIAPMPQSGGGGSGGGGF